MENSSWSFKDVWPFVDKMLNSKGLGEGLRNTQVVANICGAGESTVRSWIEDGRQPKASAMISLAEGLGISIQELMSGKISPMLQEVASETQRQVPYIEEADSNYKEIPMVDGEVFGTISPAMSDAIALKPEAFARIPQFSQGDFAVQVTGHSMKGVINHGDWIVIKKITNKNFIIYGECYLVITKSDNLKTVKYLNRDPDDDDALWLSPYNIEQFEGQSIPKEEILELYTVIGVFRKM